MKQTVTQLWLSGKNGQQQSLWHRTAKAIWEANVIIYCTAVPQSVTIRDRCHPVLGSCKTSCCFIWIFIYFSCLSGVPIETCKQVYQEERWSQPVPVSPRNTKWITVTREATVTGPLSLAEQRRLPAWCPWQSTSSSHNPLHSARLCSTSTPPRWIWKTVNVFSASRRSESLSEFWPKHSLSERFY